MALEVDAFTLLPALAALFGAIMIQIGTNFANDYMDYEKGTDRGERLGPTRMTQAGLVQPAQMKRATVVAFGLATLAGIYLVWVAGWPIVVIGILSILFGIMYTAGPFALGYNGLADFFVLIFFGPVAVGGTFYVQALTINAEVILAGIAPGLFSVGILTVNNLRDIEGDRVGGRKTLAVRFGKSFARTEYIVSLVLATLIPALLYLRGGSHLWAMLTVMVLAAAIPSIRRVLTVKGRALNDVLADTGKLLLLYSVIFSLGWCL